MQGSAALPSITWEGKGGVGHGDDAGKRKGCLNPWAPSLPQQHGLLKEDLEKLQSLVGGIWGEVRAGAGFCKPKSPINPFQALKSVPPPSGTKRLRSWWGRADRAPLTQIYYRGWIRCTRARQTWPKPGQDNAGTSERTGRSAGEPCWSVWSWQVLSTEHGRVKQHSSWSREGWGSCWDLGSLHLQLCGVYRGWFLSLPGPRLRREGSRKGEELLAQRLDFQHKESLDCLTSSNLPDSICSFISFISALIPFFIDIFQTSAI